MCEREKEEEEEGEPHPESAPLGDDDHQRGRQLSSSPQIDGHSMHLLGLFLS